MKPTRAIRQPLIFGSFSRWDGVIVAVYVALVTLLLIRLRMQPTVFADAGEYMRIGAAMRASGSLEALGPVRTYVYPAFTMVCSYVFGTGLYSLSIGVAAVQATAYGAAVIWVSRVVGRFNRVLGTSVLAGLLLNVLILNVVVEPLTDGLSVTLSVLLFGCLLQLSRSPSVSRSATWIVVGTALAFLALELRPANIVIVVAWAAALAVWWLFIARPRIEDARGVVYAFVGALTVAALIVLPQVLHNRDAYGELSVFPHAALFQVQVESGKAMLKYGTLVSGDSKVPFTSISVLYYCNPMFRPSQPGSLLAWYALNPVAGGFTLLGHIFAAFDWDYPSVYVRNLSFPYLFLSFASWLLVGLAAVVGIKEARTVRARLRDGSIRNEILPATTFISVVFCLVIAANAVTAVENRFAVIPLAIVSVFAAKWMLDLRQSWGMLSARALAVPIGIAVVGAVGSFAIHRQLTTDPCPSFGAPAVELPEVVWAARSSAYPGILLKGSNGATLFSLHPTRRNQEPETVVEMKSPVDKLRVTGTVAFYSDVCKGAQIFAGTDASSGGTLIDAGVFHPSSRPALLDVTVPNAKGRAVFLKFKGNPTGPDDITGCTMRLENVRAQPG